MTATMGVESISQGFSFAPNIAQASAAATRILDVSKPLGGDSNRGGQRVPDYGKGIKIEIQNMDFQYPTRDVSIFQGLNLTFEMG